MDKIKENLKYFTEKHPEIYEAYSNYGKMVHEIGGPLDERTRALIKVSISSVSNNEYVLKTHIKKALQSGCSKEEIEHVILLTGPTVGFPSMMASLMVFREVIE